MSYLLQVKCNDCGWKGNMNVPENRKQEQLKKAKCKKCNKIGTLIHAPFG